MRQGAGAVINNVMEITLGNYIQIGTMISMCIVFVVTLKGEYKVLAAGMTAIDKRLTMVELSLAGLNAATIQLARQEERLDSLAQRITDLERD